MISVIFNPSTIAQRFIEFANSMNIVIPTNIAEIIKKTAKNASYDDLSTKTFYIQFSKENGIAAEIACYFSTIAMNDSQYQLSIINGTISFRNGSNCKIFLSVEREG